MTLTSSLKDESRWLGKYSFRSPLSMRLRIRVAVEASLIWRKSPMPNVDLGGIPICALRTWTIWQESRCLLTLRTVLRLSFSTCYRHRGWARRFECETGLK